MGEILISPSEALLLGLCIGEFECQIESKSVLKRNRFVEIITEKLEPFYPRFSRWKTSATQNSDENQAIRVPSIDHKRHLITIKDENGVTLCSKFSLERKTLVDHLFVTLWDHLSLSDFESFCFCRDGQQACIYFEKWLKSKEQKNVAKRLETIDDARQIIMKIKSIIEHNECSTEFEVGILFGRLIFAIEEFENYVWNLETIRQSHYNNLHSNYHMDLIDEAIDRAETDLDEWYEETTKKLENEGKDPPSQDEISAKHNELISMHSERVCDLVSDWEEGEQEEFRPVLQVNLDAAISALVNSQLIRRCIHATSTLAEIQKHNNLLTLDTTEEPDTSTYLTSRMGTVKPIAKLKMSVWLAFGEVLGVLRDVDGKVISGDAASAISRTFRLLPTDTPDKVHEKLLDIEKELNNNPDLKPEEVVSRLQSCIEALARRVWPNEFTRTGFVELASILHSRLRPQHCNDLHSRFAQIALSLHKSYRNPVQHELDKFECSFEEARYFLASVRALVDLWKNISLRHS